MKKEYYLAGHARFNLNAGILALVLLLLCLCGCGKSSTTGTTDKSHENSAASEACIEENATAGDNHPLTIMIASDLHYISPDINDNGICFQNLMATADGKVTVYCEPLTDAFLSEVINAKPDALILTGDLSFNGALASHKTLAEKLAAVENSGIPVLVTTGNHDVYCGSAASFSGDDYTMLDETTSSQFEQVYHALGYDEAESRDDASLSYFYRLNDSVGFLVLDFNTEGHECAILDETLKWAENALKRAKSEGLTVIGIGHQNLYQHSMFDYGYVVTGSTDLQRLLQKYNVQVFFSGHMHIQHIMEVQGLTEIASSALSVTPLQYGVLTIDGQSMTYETRQTDVNTWAAQQGSTDDKLLHFDQTAIDIMDDISQKLCERQLSGTETGKDEQTSMTDYFCRVNRAYFAGDLTAVFSTENAHELHQLWTSSGTMNGIYLKSLESEIGKDYTHWSNS